MKQFKILFAYLLCICLSVSCSDSDETIVYSTPLRTVITGMDYGDGVLVVGHKSPDCDAVLSAMTYASLLQRMGINAEARVAGKVICEPRYVLQEAGIEAPAILDDAAGQNIIMTDHSEFAQAANGMSSARILHIIDHHGTGSVTTAQPLFYYALPVGSTCTIIASMYEELGEKPTATDRRLYEWLLQQSDLSDVETYYAAMRKARTSFDGMTDEDILFSDYKEYEIEGYKVGIGNVFASDELGVEELCQRMRQIMPAVRTQQDLDMLFMMLGDRQANVTHIPICGDGAREAAEAGFGASANSDGCIVTTYISSRKAQFLPAITEGIRKSNF